MSTSWKNKVAYNFGRKADTYDQQAIVQTHAAAKLAADLPDLSPEARILEIGCGTGLLTHHLVEIYKAQELHITDINPEMLAKARSKIHSPKITWRIFDGETATGKDRNDNADKQYDLIISSMVFQWFEDLEKSLQALEKLLKPGGKIMFTMPGSRSFCEWRAILTELEYPIGLLKMTPPEYTYHREEIAIPCQNAQDFLHSMKSLGAGSARKNYKPLSITKMKRACTLFEQRDIQAITWEILYARFPLF